MKTGLHDAHGQMINEKDVVNYAGEKFNRVVRYYPKYMAFSLDDERTDSSHKFLAGFGKWFEEDGKLCSPDIEIRSTFVED